MSKKTEPAVEYRLPRDVALRHLGMFVRERLPDEVLYQKVAAANIPYRWGVEFASWVWSAPTVFRELLVEEAEDEANKKWPADRGEYNRQLAEDFTNSCCGALWSRFARLARKYGYRDEKAMWRLKALTQYEVNHTMDDRQRADLAKMAEHVLSLIDLAVPSN